MTANDLPDLQWVQQGDVFFSHFQQHRLRAKRLSNSATWIVSRQYDGEWLYVDAGASLALAAGKAVKSLSRRGAM